LATAIAVATAGVSSGEPTRAAAVTAKGGGTLVIYGNAPGAQMKTVLDAFGKAYPGIKANYSDQEDNVSFSKYRAEHAQHARTADIIIASSPMNWKNNRGIALPWNPIDAGAYPSFRKQFPGVFIFSPDPAVSVYSKAQLPGNRVPHSFKDLVAFTKKYPNLFKKKIVTFSVDNQYGYTAFWGLTHRIGWSPLNALGPASKPQPDGTALVTQIVKGGANYGYLMSGLVRRNLVGDIAKVVGWTYMKDFTPLVPRGVAITKGAANPGAAKKFLNWAYSAKGQSVLCAVGFTAYRRGVSCASSLSSIQKAVGAKNTYLVPFNSSIANDHKAFVKRWNKAFH
jgi:iron(III) transport system substrate-binding protein